MRIKDVLRISLKNIRIYFKRNLIIMAVMGVIFGIVFAINLWFQGMENSYTELANQSTEGRVIIEATNSMEGMILDDALPKTTRQEMSEDIEAHGGKVLGDAEKFGLFGSVVLSKELVENRIMVDMEEVPVDAAPVLVSTFLGEQLLGKSFPAEYTNAVRKQKDYKEYQDKLIGKTFTDAYGAKYYVVGLNSGNFHVDNLSFNQLEQGSNNILNPVLAFVATPNGSPIVIDNGKSESWQKGEKISLEDIVGIKTESESLIAVFDDSKSAYEYFQHGKGRFMNVDLPSRTYSVNIVAGMSPETMYIIENMNFVINIVSVALGLIAAIVVVFTSIRLVDQDRQNVALYYSLGATTRQVRTIYLFYFLELMIGAAILAFCSASVIVLAFSFLNQEILGIQSALGFNLVATPGEIWYAVNAGTFVIIVAMLTVSFICIAINNKRLAKESFSSI
jgi:hypothetical protein